MRLKKDMLSGAFQPLRFCLVWILILSLGSGLGGPLTSAEENNAPLDASPTPNVEGPLSTPRLNVPALLPEPVRSGSDDEPELSRIPRKPSTPPSLNQKFAESKPHCERFFLYRGKKSECDSNLGNDAERLRPIMADTPQALKELDIYESNRSTLKTTAYLGSIGLLAVILGLVISHPPVDQTTGALRPGGFFMIGGLALSVNSMLYGYSLIRNNESHIGKAVDYFNSAHPNSPIELQFSTPVNF